MDIFGSGWESPESSDSGFSVWWWWWGGGGGGGQCGGLGTRSHCFQVLLRSWAHFVWRQRGGGGGGGKLIPRKETVGGSGFLL